MAEQEGAIECLNRILLPRHGPSTSTGAAPAAPAALHLNQLDAEVSAAQRALFPDTLKCFEFARSWGLLDRSRRLSALRLAVLLDLVVVLTSSPESLLRCHSVNGEQVDRQGGLMRLGLIN